MHRPTARAAAIQHLVLALCPLLALLSACANAQDDTGGEAAVENIIVTGSRITRRDFEVASPLVTVPGELFQDTGATSVERTLARLPQIDLASGSTSNDPSRDGQANISLRGLGVAQTLVLLDGRRLLPADGSGSVDLNVVPPALIERVEVVTGGASAAYGSDAIAGVVNFKLRDRFEGVALDGSWSATGQGDGEEYTAGVTAGTSFWAGRGSVMGYASYTEHKQVNQSDRAFSRYPLQYFADVTNGLGPGGAFLGSGSGITDDGLSILFPSTAVFQETFASYGYPPGSVATQPGFGQNADGTVFTIGDGVTPGSVANYRGERDPVMFNDRGYNPYNYAPSTALQMPFERDIVFLRGQVDLSNSAELYVQALYADYTVNRQLAPTDAGIILIPTTNPYIGADLQTLLASRVAPTAPFRYFKRTTAVGPRIAENDRDVLQLTGGIRGEVFEDWRYDVYLQSGHNDRTEQQSGVVRISRFQDLTFAPDGGVAICRGLNPFGVDSIPAACARYIAAEAANKVDVDQTLAEALVEGPLFVLPAGELRVAAGVFYKRDEFAFASDPILSAVLPGVPGVIGPRPDITGFPSGADRSGRQSNTDLYVEALAPLLRDRPGAQSLELGLGYRYSDYSIAGGADSYKAELSWQPLKPLRLRGSYQHAVRAPSIDELFYPELSNQFLLGPPGLAPWDPCDVDSQSRQGPDGVQVAALCVAQGIAPEQIDSFNYELRRVDGVSGGNPGLDPEQADTQTVGLVFTSPFESPGLANLTVALDWYRIDLTAAIGRWDSESAVQRCYDPAYNPTYTVDNVYCSFFRRTAATGEIFAVIIDRNIGGIETSGVDLQVDWSANAGSGRVGANLLLNHVFGWKYAEPNGGTIDYAGTIGGGGLGRAVPEWKSLLNLSYSRGPVEVFARWQYIDGMRDAEVPAFQVPACDYFDLGGSYAFNSRPLEGLTLRAGVENLLDDDPPIFPTWQQANTDPTLYDVLGRRYFVGLGYKF